jgi:hypothetical protein
MGHKIIEIHRQYSFSEEANRDPEVRAYFDMSYRGIGSYPRVIGKIPESGLTMMEEELLMPQLVGFNPTDKEFRQEVNKFFTDLNTKIPAEGLKLDIGLMDDDAPLSKDNYPLKPMDYVKWRHAMKHPQVAKNREEAERYQHKKFYIIDFSEEKLTASKMLKIEDEAQIKYLEARDSAEKTEMILTLLNVDTRNMSGDDMALEIKRQSTSDPNQSDVLNEEKLRRFVTVCKDRDLQIKYDIYQMISYNVFERVSRKILDRETGSVIGNNLKEAVVYMMDKGNAKQVNYYYAELDERKRSQGKAPIVRESARKEQAASATSKAQSTKATKTKTNKKVEETVASVDSSGQEDDQAALAEYDDNSSMSDFEVDDDES